MLTKIMAMVCVLSAVSGGITWLGIRSLKGMSGAAQETSLKAHEALAAQQLMTSLFAINRAELMLAADPTPQRLETTRTATEAESQRFSKQFAWLKANATEAEVQAAAFDLDTGWQVYQKSLEAILQAAHALTQSKNNATALKTLHDEVETSSRVADHLQGSISSVVQASDAAVNTASASATSEYRSVSKVMMVAAVIGILLSFAFAIAIGQFGIAKPMRKLVALLQRMAQGEAVEITGTERGDEVGATARAVDEISVMLAEKARREAEEKAAADRERTRREAEAAARTAEEREAHEKRAAAERDAAMQTMAEEFEVAVGGIVNAAVAGDFSQRVNLEGKTGLVYNVGTAINSLCENVAMALDDLVEMLNALADGNLTRRITADYRGSFALLKDNANKTAERISSTVADIKAAAGEVTSASMEITTSTTDLSQRTEEQAASLEETSASMEEIAATVRKNAENAQQANASAGSTREVADRGGQVVAQAVAAMARIEESSRKISDIIGVIDEIARQTNLLALNAAVEAA
ncbi:MAG TPA: methyl-accepting chemotaxis protein, partial [Pseudolabrys sp.]|nr:methyl-accepting chemotaxis protein [Pseudolabrys sp.]